MHRGSLCQDKYKGDSIVQMIFDDSLSINGHTFTFDFVVDVETSQVLFAVLVGAAFC
ncbi:hypothetical protein MtrunA17_Chr4g0024591 [Medicago truncatula]|uniref:Kinesin-12 family protein, putative n=1 Tax=Medicago truncatula TaxID=3880 RepID=G7JDJ6_MEDTR|nr:kinesin-12 family protein, putative [Medicago truncatula]RHN60328.1 hypothetical protein MtrunA17_Chr4g0024591 [Medicago truncatula]